MSKDDVNDNVQHIWLWRQKSVPKFQHFWRFDAFDGRRAKVESVGRGDSDGEGKGVGLAMGVGGSFIVVTLMDVGVKVRVVKFLAN